MAAVPIGIWFWVVIPLPSFSLVYKLSKFLLPLLIIITMMQKILVVLYKKTGRTLSIFQVGERQSFLWFLASPFVVAHTLLSWYMIGEDP